MPLGKRTLSCLCLLGYLGIAPETLAKPLSSHPYRKQATRPLPPAVAPKFRKVWRSQIQQSALPPARPHLSQQGRAKPATVGSALPPVAWQIKEMLPATPTRRQRVIWQVHSLAETQPGYVVTASRSHSIPRQRPPLMRPAISRSPASAVSPATATTTTAAYRHTPNASPARQPAAPVLINYLAHQGQQWLNQWGEAEISLQGSRTDRLQGSAALLLPLKQTQQQQLFTQGGWYRDQEGALFSLGLGQRWLYARQRYWGCNLFYDYRRQGHHQRLGVGLEQRSNSLTWTLNSYWPLSAQRLVDQRANWVRPARGVDLRLQYQPAQQPHWQVNLTAERYFGTTRAARGQSLRHNPTAVTLGVNYTPLPLLSAGYGFTLGTGKQRSHQLQLALRYHLGVPCSQQLDPQQVAAQSLIGNRLALVPRNLRMVLQQQPNDEIQLELLPIAPQPVGRQVKLAIHLRSPRPLAEWTLHWRGDLLQHSPPPPINAAKDQAVVTLPRCPGTYTLQLIARNARGVVSYSNRLQIVVEALAVPAEKHQRAVVTKATPPPVLPPEPVTIPSLGQRNQPATTADRSSTPPAKNSPAVPAKGVEDKDEKESQVEKGDPSSTRLDTATVDNQASGPLDAQLPLHPTEPVQELSSGMSVHQPTIQDRFSTPPMPVRHPKNAHQDFETSPTGRNKKSKKHKKSKQKTCWPTETPPTRTPGSSGSSPGSEKDMDGDGLERRGEESVLLTKPLTAPTVNPMQNPLHPGQLIEAKESRETSAEANPSSRPSASSPKMSNRKPPIQTNNLQPQSDYEERDRHQISDGMGMAPYTHYIPPPTYKEEKLTPYQKEKKEIRDHINETFFKIDYEDVGFSLHETLHELSEIKDYREGDTLFQIKDIMDGAMYIADMQDHKKRDNIVDKLNKIVIKAERKALDESELLDLLDDEIMKIPDYPDLY